MTKWEMQALITGNPKAKDNSHELKDQSLAAFKVKHSSGTTGSVKLGQHSMQQQHQSLKSYYSNYGSSAVNAKRGTHNIKGPSRNSHFTSQHEQSGNNHQHPVFQGGQSTNGSDTLDPMCKTSPHGFDLDSRKQQNSHSLQPRNRIRNAGRLTIQQYLALNEHYSHQCEGVQPSSTQ